MPPGTSPDNKTSDANEPTFDGTRVTVIPEVKEAIDAFAKADLIGITVDDGWGALSCRCAWRMPRSRRCSPPHQHSGYVVLTMANANLLAKFGTDEQREHYVKPMLAGRFTGTMALSETQAGSSLADITTRAEPRDDGTHRLFGSKMWISGARNQMSDNIVSLVLAKIPGGPSGTKGISSFIVPSSWFAPTAPSVSATTWRWRG